MLFLFSFILISCYSEDDYSPSKLSKIINLRIESNNQLADGVSKIKVIAEFPDDFSTEDNNLVTFVIDDQKIEAEIRLVEEGGINIKISEINLISRTIKNSTIKAIISIRGSEISKEKNVSFRRAYCESINLSSSSLIIRPDSSFAEIILTSKLLRNNGFVTSGTEGFTKVVDINGVKRGILVNNNFKTDSDGFIINKFTMGNDPYTGLLYAVTESTDEFGEIKNDTLIIYAQK